MPQDYDGQCVPPRREGAPCDADWGEPGCAVCEPGTECLADPRAPGARVCLRPCSDAGDCACPSDDPAVLDTCQATLPEPSSGQGACTGCGATGGQCAGGAEGWGCCDPADRCLGGACCRPLGAACGASAECCGRGECAGGLCRVCGAAGAPPDAVLGCCAGLVDRDGVCSVPCDAGAPCNPPGCPGRLGTTVCSPTAASCRVETTPEVCNGVDDDCDGRTDEGIAPRSCEADPGGCGRNLPGTQACAGGAWGPCEVTDFCRYQYATDAPVPGVPPGFSMGSGVSLYDCRWGRELCDSTVPGGGGDAACPPGTVCLGNCEDPPQFICWPHDETLTCRGVVRWAAEPCQGVLCWTVAEYASPSPPSGSRSCL